MALGLVPATETLAAAGDVSAVRDPATGVLRITGDDQANDIEVTADDPLGSTFTVTGRNGTTVNLGAAQTFDDVRGLSIHAGAGDDVVDLTGLRVARNLVVQMQDGADVLSVTRTRVLGRTALAGGTGDDRIVVQGFFRRTFAARGGAGDDSIHVEDTTFRGRGRVLFDCGLGGDSTFIGTSEFHRGASVTILGRRGDDDVVVQGTDFDDDLTVSLAAGDDHLTLETTEFGQDVDLLGGPGRDDLSLRSGNRFHHIPDVHGFDK